MRSICAGVVVAATLLWQAPSAAGDPAVAREQLKIGYTLAQDGKCEEAIPHLLESLRLDPKAIALINLADCEEKVGKLADAMGHWVDARTRAQTEGARAIEEEAEKRTAALEPRLARLTIVLAPSAPPDAVVVRDGVALGEPSLGIPLPLDPGVHELVVKAKGRPDSVVEIDLSEGQSKRVELDAGAGAGAVARSSPAPAPALRGGDAASSGRTLSPLVFVGFGVAVAGAALGAVTGVQALRAGSEAEDRCRSLRCDPKTFDEVESGRTMGTISTLSFVVAGLGAAIGATGLLASSRGAPKKRESVVGAAVGPSFVSLRGRF